MTIDAQIAIGFLLGYLAGTFLALKAVDWIDRVLWPEES
jgi:hypothetical protein